MVWNKPEKLGLKAKAKTKKLNKIMIDYSKHLIFIFYYRKEVGVREVLVEI